MLKVGCSFLLIGCLIGCASQPWQVAELDVVKQAADPKQSTLPSYDLTAAQWVENQPLLINKDFNFGMAMSMEGVGVAIAAGMRINKNKELAKTLATMPPLTLEQRWREAANKHRGPRRDTQVVLFTMLYGQPQAQLRTVVEFHPPDGPPERFVDISHWSAAMGDNSWAANNGENIIKQIDQSLTVIVELLNQDLVASGKEQEFSVSGGEAVQRGRGYLVAKDDGSVVIKTTSIPNTIIRLPAEVVSLRDYEEPPEF